jgi:hypothetical protein
LRGANAFIPKPIDYRLLTDVIERWTPTESEK